MPTVKQTIARNSGGASAATQYRKSARTYSPNLRSVKAVVDGSSKKISVCSRCLRSGLVERA